MTSNCRTLQKLVRQIMKINGHAGLSHFRENSTESEKK
jgi:hypothetical protein